MCAKATAQINYGDQLGYPYQKRYWFAQQAIKGIMPVFFNKKTGLPIPRYMYRRTTTLPLIMKYNGKEVDYIEFTLTSCYQQLKNPEDLLTIRAGEFSEMIPAKDVSDSTRNALRSHGHPLALPILSAAIYQNCRSVKNSQLSVLREFVHIGFLCYLRDETDHYVVDAVLETKGEIETKNVLSKLSGVGLFPRMFGKKLVVEAVNDRVVGNAIWRLELEKSQVEVEAKSSYTIS